MSLRNLISCSALLLVFTAGCGGGGGGGGGSHASQQIPTAPANLTVAMQGADVVLSWTASPGAASYELYASQTAGITGTPAEHVASLAAAPARIQGVAPGTTLFFRVTAKNGVGESGLSNEVQIDVVSPTGPDPLFTNQWHLNNNGQLGGTPGQDAHVQPAWAAGFTGEGVRIAIVDDGLEIGHEDLSANVVPGKSHNYVDGSTNPTGGSHGTSCGGVAASVGDNGLGGKGSAYDAELVGYNILANLTVANEIDAMTRNAPEIWVSSNSWGATDGLGVPQPASSTFEQAVVSGLTNGRNGKGTVYLWAAGNGAQVQGMTADNSNLDGRANFLGVIAIGAVGDDGVKAFYSENGANLLVASPSMGRANHAITTVDRSGAAGYNTGQSATDYGDTNYTNTFNGTSSATPLVSGVVALILEANPNLTWRDVRQVLAKSARLNDANDADWTLNGAGLHVNHKYGFGVIDAAAAVQLAQNWTNVGPLLSLQTPVMTPNLAIPDNDPLGVHDGLVVIGSGIQKIESVRVFFDADDHTYSADLEVVLTSPSGTESVLAEHHVAPQGALPYDDWVFSTNRLLDEPADGTWTIAVRDLEGNDVGTLKAWALLIYGR